MNLLKLFSFTKRNIIAFTFTVLMPVAIMIFGCILLSKGFLLTFSFLLAFYIVPLVATAGSFLFVFSRLRTKLKIFFCIALLIILAVVFCALLEFGYYEILDKYKENEIAENYKTAGYFPMPTLDEIGEPTSIEYYCFSSFYFIIFGCDTETLICTYNDADYREQKALLDEKYMFMENTIKSYGFSQTYELDPTINVNGYTFRFIDEDESDDYYIQFPKHLMLVATNDDTNEIIYMSFYDDDLDYVDSLRDFVLYDCGFRRIR